MSSRFLPSWTGGLSKLKAFLRLPDDTSVPDLIFTTSVLAMFGFGIFLAFLNEVLDLRPATWLAGSCTPTAFCAMLLVRARRTLWAKLLIHVHAAIVIFSISMMFSQSSAVLFFILPVFTSLAIVFDVQERPVAAATAVVLLLVSMWLMYADPRFMPVELEADRMPVVRSVSLFGALGFTLFQVMYTVRVNDLFRQGLQEMNRRSAVYNRVLESSVTERNRLIQMISHDLRSPFSNLIVGMDDAVIDGLAERERLALVRRIRSEARSTLEMLDGILLWIRSRQGSLKLDIHPSPVRPVLQQVDAWLNHDAVRKGVGLEFRLERDMQARADEYALASILRNLVSNALKFTPAGGQVSVDVVQERESIRFTVRDTGKGMSVSELSAVRARDAFSSRGTEQEKGHGVGLLIVHDFLDKHYATLEVSSTPGHGSCFSFLLPMA